MYGEFHLSLNHWYIHYFINAERIYVQTPTNYKWFDIKL